MTFEKLAYGILVWRYSDAPDRLKPLISQVLGNSLIGEPERDPDWLVYVPDALNDPWISWTEGRNFHDLFGIVLGKHHPRASLDLLTDRTIVVFWYEKACQLWKDICCQGGDEDWIAFVPGEMTGDRIDWMASGTNFGGSSVDEYELPNGNGAVLRVGSHA